MDPKINIAIIVALISAVITTAGWLVSHLLEQKRSQKTRAQEARIAFKQRQIEEFYGPLSNLAIQIVVTNHVLFGLLHSKPDERSKIEEVFYFEYFQPLHKEARNLIKTKLHLVEGKRLPESFYQYLTASIQEEMQRHLWKDHGLDTKEVKGKPYPDSFTADVQQELEKLMAENE